MTEHFIIILSSPSGTGKSTLTKMLLEKYNDIKLSISATTRHPREGEKHGVHYHFIAQEDFDKKVINNEFFEYAGVYGKSYGTLKNEVEKNWQKSNDVLLDIDWQGNLLVQKQLVNKSKLLTIFILPPSIKELRKRLEGRNTDSQEIIDKRMADAKNTITHYNEYDYVIINDNLEHCFQKICALIEHKRKINRENKEIVDKILSE
jgi:guanylate kinase